MPFAINIAVHRNRNRRVNSRGNGRTIKGYDNRNAVFATESGILGVGSNIASTTIKGYICSAVAFF